MTAPEEAKMVLRYATNLVFHLEQQKVEAGREWEVPQCRPFIRKMKDLFADASILGILRIERGGMTSMTERKCC